MKHKFLSLFALLALTAFTALPVRADLAPPNATGVSMGHVHLVVKDVEAEKKFLVLLGGVPVSNGTLQMVQFRECSSTFARARRLAAPSAPA